MKGAALLVILCACGDNEPEIEVFEPTNGTRLTIEQYQFDDGTRLVQPTAFYDRRIHARCTPQEWIDGVVRCVPDAEEAFYREDTCDTLFGVGNAIKFATHFIATNTRDGQRYGALTFAAGARITTPIEQAFYLDGETCVPTTIPVLATTTFWELGNFVSELVPITEREIGEGRLGLTVRESDDGALVPVGFRDRELDIACTPGPRDGELGACEPIDAPVSDVFADNACTQPAILAAEDTDAPRVASTRGNDGCLAYHAVETTQTPRAYRDISGGCASVSTSLRVHALGAPVDLAPMTRTTEDAPKRRVQRILASEGDLHVYATRLFDTATRAECSLRLVGKTLRCLPTALAPIVRLFQPGCTVERRLAEVPRVACEPFAFAVNDTGETLELHAIGDPFEGTAYTLAPSGACLPYTPSATASLHAVGPILSEETFAGAVPFGAR